MTKIYWKAEEFKYHKKSPDWYWIFWSISALFAFLTYYIWDDYIFSALIIISAVVLTIASFKKPEVKTYGLDKENIYLDNEKEQIPFEEIKEYNIDSVNMKILINTKNKYQKVILIPFEASQNINKIDKFLSSKIKKNEELQIPFLELLLNKFING